MGATQNPAHGSHFRYLQGSELALEGQQRNPGRVGENGCQKKQQTGSRLEGRMQRLALEETDPDTHGTTNLTLSSRVRQSSNA